MFISFVQISEVFFFPRSCRKCCHSEKPTRGCPLLFCDPQPADDEDTIHFWELP